MKIQELITIKGGVYKFASLLGVTPTAVYHWLYGTRRPCTDNALQIEKYSGGEIKAYDVLVNEKWR